MSAHPGFEAAFSTHIDAQLGSTFCMLYRHRRDNLFRLKQLLQVIRLVQKHRGMSMALLGGNPAFEIPLTRLQHQLAYRVEILRALNPVGVDSATETNPGHIIVDQESWHTTWQALTRSWQHQSVIDIYEQHCALIEQLLQWLACLGKTVEHPVSWQLTSADNSPALSPAPTLQHADTPSAAPDDRSGQESNRDNGRDAGIVQLTTHYLPALIEQVGRVRALGTYAAAEGRCDTYHAQKLRAVVLSARENNERLRLQLKHLGTIPGLSTHWLGQIHNSEAKLALLLSMVDEDVLTNNYVSIDSTDLFAVASELIDHYFKTIDEGLNRIERWHESDLESWLQSR